MSDRLEALRSASTESDYRGFRCWSEGDVGEIMHREAAAPSRAVLLATHQPPKIRRVRVTEAGRYGTEDIIGQDELLDRVRSAADQALIVPVIGAAGSGKSHLVLWLRARLEDDDDPNRKVVYLPKGETRLDRVIERILDGRTGPPFDEIRESVAAAAASLTLDDAARALRDALSLAIGNIDASGTGDVAEMRMYLREMLPNLLDDPLFARRLVKGDGPLRRIVEQMNTGGNEAPAELFPDELDVQVTDYELPDFSVLARPVLNDLNSNPQLYAAAVDLLNTEMSRCLGTVFGVQPMQLVAVMRELRTRLYDENPALELVLMIEDFTLLQGIQHDLVEAMIELPRREGRQVMCAMKTVMAVTDGFFTRVLASSDTLRTRIAAQGHVYNLDVAYGSDDTAGLDPEAVVDFAGRYLNAVRLGSRDLDAAAPAVHNACDVCAHRDACHEAFGTSPGSEYGLYPFNDVALDRMVRSRQDKFNPRDLLAVMAMTLTAHAQELEDGRFPSPGWARNFDPRQFERPLLDTLSTRVQEHVNQTPKPEQRSVLLTFWGGVPAEFRNLPKGIHDAFDVPIASGAKTAAPSRPQPQPTRVETTAARSVDRYAEAVQAWRDGTRLETDLAHILRRVIHEAILGVLDAEDALLSDQLLSGFFDKTTDIDIKNSAGQSRSAPGRFRVELEASNDNALLFEGILKMQQRGSWDVDGGASTLVRFMTLIDSEATRLRTFLNERIVERDADRRAAVSLLALSGLVAGRGGAADVPGLLAAAMNVSEATTPEAMPGLWRTLVDMTAQRRPVVREFVLQAAHVSKSTSEPAGVDGRQFSDPLREMSTKWDLPALSDDAPKQVALLRQLLDQRLQPALAEAHEALVAWYAEVTRLVGDADSASARYKKWREALEAAQAQGFLARARGFSDDAPPARLGDLIRTVGTILERWPDLDLGRRAAMIAKAPWGRLDPALDHLIALESTLIASAEKAQTQRGNGGETSPIDAFEGALARIQVAAAIEVAS